MSEQKTYRVTVTRDGDAWLADVPELRGAHTYARNLRSLERYVREVVVLAADLPDGAEDAFALDWTFDTGDAQVNRVTGELRARRAEIDQATQDLSSRTAEVARQLVGSGWSVRDVATLLDVSPQRVSQVTSSARQTATQRVATPKKAASKRAAVTKAAAARRATRAARRRAAADPTEARHAS